MTTRTPKVWGLILWAALAFLCLGDGRSVSGSQPAAPGDGSASIGRPPATGVLVHEDWARWAAVADLYPKGQHAHAGLGPSPMQFRVEGQVQYLPAGWDSARVFNSMLALGADPSGVFPRVLGIRLQPGANLAAATWMDPGAAVGAWGRRAEVRGGGEPARRPHGRVDHVGRAFGPG